MRRECLTRPKRHSLNTITATTNDPITTIPNAIPNALAKMTTTIAIGKVINKTFRKW